MPIKPSVFQPIRANDVQQRPIKTYKHYTVTNSSSIFLTSSGYFRHQGVYKRTTPHIDPTTGEGVGTLVYPINTEDDTNQHVIWEQVDHRFYKRNDPANAFDFTDIEKQKRFLWYSASIFTAPYGQVGERIKPGSVTVTSSLPSYTNCPDLMLFDDGDGNLRDPRIESSSFASESRCILCMSFNNTFRGFEDPGSLGSYDKNFTYTLNKVEKYSVTQSGIQIVDGIDQQSVAAQKYPSGLAAKFDSRGHIRIPHHDKFDRFNFCDDWTISFWHKNISGAVLDTDLITKYAIGEEMYLDAVDGKRKLRDFEKNYVPPITGDFSKIRMPFHISAKRNVVTDQFYFKSSDGSKQLVISSSAINAPGGTWKHILVRNSGSMCEMFINGLYGLTSSGSLPQEPTANKADIVIGAAAAGFAKSPSGSAKDVQLSEIRIYDYAVNNEAIASLCNNHYLSGSLYQTNVAGNVFYKNGNIVVSSPNARYASGSGVFDYSTTKYRGTHTIYENEVLVRVPKDQFNVTMNPTSTYRPATTVDVCDTSQKNMLPGELRKGLFVSGTLVPYITTIGLYDDKARMLATAKLGQPIQKNDDVDMHFVVRWDY
tara:strand:- start:4481 stop:6271 length:1791 start_codon:yes stop_codon:yes gene_type:complete